MGRIVAICIGVALGGLAGVVLAMATLVDVVRVLGPGMARFEPFIRLGGMAAGGLILAAAFLVVGVGVGRWRRPVPSHHRRRPEVRW